MKLVSISFIILGLALTGCVKESKTGKADGNGTKTSATKSTSPTDSSKSTATADSSAKPSAGNGAAAGTEVPLTPENTKIEFVGTHVGEKPDPRKGHFEKFSGTANVDGAKLTSVKVDIETESLTTEIEKLTNHLKSPDFFDVRQYPKASFESTSIEPAGEGKVNITGNLTLHNETKSITFPATVSTDKGLSLKSEFQIDRTQFGINFGPDRVEKQVAMTVTVGN